VLVAGCGPATPEPELASSARHAGYAQAYPTDVQAITADFGQDQAEIKKTVGAFDKYEGELKNPNYNYVLEIYQRADEAGRSYAYVDRLREIHDAKTFFDDEKDEITRKVSGSAQYVTKQKGCDVDVSGAVAHALKESVDKQLEKRLHEASEAHRLIDRYREELGKENAAALERQADEISYAAYLAHVAIVEQKVRLRRMIEEAETVKKTADDFIAAEHEYQSKSGRTAADRKASDDRIAAMNKSKALIDSAVTQAKTTSEGMEDRITAAQKEYDDGIKKLEESIRAKAGGK
jgi:hypothetical protein